MLLPGASLREGRERLRNVRQHDMHGTSTPTGPAALIFQLAALLHDAAGELRALAMRVDARMAERKRQQETRRILAEMSDRELRDIGLDRAQLRAVHAGHPVREIDAPTSRAC
jgi:uncharacterized protein YjiS (DUF1127 family)